MLVSSPLALATHLIDAGVTSGNYFVIIHHAKRLTDFLSFKTGFGKTSLKRQEIKTLIASIIIFQGEQI